MSVKKVVIIGRPNVGKSSLFNRIVGRRQAIVHDVAGTTRDLLREEITVQNKSFELTDTAGYLKEKGNLLSDEALKKVMEAVNYADLLVFVVDGTVSPTNVDVQMADIARKSSKKVLLVVNKIDNSKKTEYLKEYERFGFKQLFAISAIHNIGVAGFLNGLLENIPDSKNKRAEEVEDQKEIKISILGRPNVGKSSILNAITKKERAIVSNIPGTTRDVVSEKIKGENFTFSISDTAGARKPGKIGMAAKKGEPVEKYSYLRTEREIENSDIVLIVVDASERIAAQDLHIAGKAKELGKGIILVVNKWDLVSEVTQEKFLARLRREFNFMMWVPAIFISAKTGRNVDEILNIVITVHKNQTQEVTTAKLNRILEDFALAHPPRGLKNFWPKVHFIVQTGTKPPTFTISAKYHNFVHFSWRRSIENEIRRHFDFTGTPIKIEFKENKK